jgi:hypothetical protein
MRSLDLIINHRTMERKNIKEDHSRERRSQNMRLSRGKEPATQVMGRSPVCSLHTLSMSRG